MLRERDREKVGEIEFPLEEKKCINIRIHITRARSDNENKDNSLSAL